MRFRFLVSVICLCLVSSVYGATSAPSSIAKELLKPSVFPDAQLGMAVISAEDGPTATVTTLGGVFVIDKAKDTIQCKQRVFVWNGRWESIDYDKQSIDKVTSERPVTTIKLAAGSLAGIKLTSKTSGAAIFTDNSTTIRINGDSLLMIQPCKGGDIKAELSFTPDYFISNKGNYNFFDPYGGVSFFEHGNSPITTLQTKTDPVTVTWPWKAGDVFWASVSTPKPYDWNASINSKVLLHDFNEDRYMYPSDLSLFFMSKYSGNSNSLYLHNDRLWDGSNPRDASEFKRVVSNTHEYGEKVVVDAPTGLTGLQQIEGAVKQYGIDGICLDDAGQFPQSLADRYYTARAARKVVGDTGLLYLHSTGDSLANGISIPVCPAIDAQFNIVWKTGNWKDMKNPGYARYEFSTYNISNAILTQALSADDIPSSDMIDYWMRASNVRYFVREEWCFNKGIDTMKTNYLDRLKPLLKSEIGPELISRPTGIFEQYRKAMVK